MKTSTYIIISILALFSLGLNAQGTRDPFLQPFSVNSPWNMPVGCGAIYTPIPNISSLQGGVNYQQAWTTGIYKATTSDRVARLYIYKGDMWTEINSGRVKITGNSATIENELRANSQSTPLSVCNRYSTVVPSPPGQWTPPSNIRDINAGWTNTIYVPVNATPSPDTDAHIAIYQPSGLVLEVYSTVICANGDIVCQIASFTDPRSDGSGFQNGRVASLFPNYAGKIRNGGITAGKIPHSLCITVPVSMLKTEYVYPAYAFDMNDGYFGTIPMGALLAIPPTVDINTLGLTAKGKVIAKCAQDYGLYIMDRGGGGITIQAELGNTEVNYPESGNDMTIIVRQLMHISNNSQNNLGGGGTPRQPLAAELKP